MLENQLFGIRDPNILGLDLVVFTDDTVLLALTHILLEKQLNGLRRFLRLGGFENNPSKTITFSVVPSGLDKKVKVDSSSKVLFGDVVPPIFNTAMLWRYQC